MIRLYPNNSVASSPMVAPDSPSNTKIILPPNEVGVS